MRVEDERVREECERLVNVLMRGEEGEEMDEIPTGEGKGKGAGVRQGMVQEIEDDHGTDGAKNLVETKDDGGDDDEIVDVF